MTTPRIDATQEPRSPRNAVGVIVGSAFSLDVLEDLDPETVEVDTPWGRWQLWRLRGVDRTAVVSFRHGFPHRLLPNQIPFRAQAHALAAARCGALLVTSSVGVLDASLPLFAPMLVGDILMLENRLPDGTACTMFQEQRRDQAHLVLREGLLSDRLTETVGALCRAEGWEPVKDLVFGYVGGPRTKTAAENRMWAGLGAQVNSMTLAPEIVLANELAIPCAGLVVGHKHSLVGPTLPAGPNAVSDSLAASKIALGRIVRRFLQEAAPVPFGNELFRFAP